MNDDAPVSFTAQEIHHLVSTKLANTFDAVAKEAMQAAAMARDPSVFWNEKIEESHRRVTLIIETAMRGIGKASGFATMASMVFGAQSRDDSSDSSSE